MRVRLILPMVLVAGVLVVGSATGAGSDVETRGFGPYAKWTAKAKTSPPAGQIVVNRGVGGCSFAERACTTYAGEVWIRPKVGRRTFYHELGHVFHLRMSEQERQDVPGGFSPERFADDYRDCALGARGDICDFIRGAA